MEWEAIKILLLLLPQNAISVALGYCLGDIFGTFFCSWPEPLFPPWFSLGIKLLGSTSLPMLFEDVLGLLPFAKQKAPAVSGTGTKSPTFHKKCLTYY